MSPVITQNLSTSPKYIRSSFMVAVLSLAASSWSAVDLQQFTPGVNVINYSVYTTDSIYLPSGSGLANGGLFGSGGGVLLSDGMKLRAPKITVGRTFTLGANSDSLPKTVVGGNATVGNSTKSFDTLQVGGNLASVANDLTFKAPVAIGGNLTLSGNQLAFNNQLRLGGTYTSTNLAFSAAAQVRMAAASGGPSIPASQISYGVPYATLLNAPLVVGGASLPAYTISGYAPPATVQNVNLSGPANSATDTKVIFLSPDTTTAYYWKCSNAGLPAGSCNGDTLLPGYYGNLTLTGNGRALLLTEGFYSFKSISMGGSNAMIAGQPKGGRTVVYSENDITANSSHAFIGPNGARLATGFGSDSTKFLGGTMMLATAKNMVIPNDNRIWATLSAPAGDIHLSSQVALFGQAYAKRLIGDNNIDFGQGAFIKFRGDVPALTGPNFKVGEKVDTSCHDVTGKPCRDTVLTLRIPSVTAYEGSFFYEIVESATRSAIAGVDFSADTGTLYIPINELTTKLKVRIFNDSSYEGPETFTVRLSKPVSVGFPKVAGGLTDTSIHSYEFTGTIIDDDLAPLVKVFADSAVKEGNAGTHAQTFTTRLYDPYSPANPLALTNAPQIPVSFRWRTLDASATVLDSDYVAQATRWDTIPALGLTKSISVLVKGDTRYETDEFYTVAIDTARNGTVVGTVSDSGIVLNDDVAPTVTVSGISVQEPAKYGDTAWATFTYRISSASGLTTTIFWHTLDGSAKGTTNFATSSNDYLTTSGSLAIPHDTLSGTVRIAVFGDTLFEKSETFKLVLDSITNGIIGDSSATATILDADSAPSVSVSNAIVREPSTGTTVLRFPIHLSRPSGLPSLFVWTTQDGSALAGVDYKAVSSDTMRLPAFLRDTVLEVVVYSDSVAGEGDETFTVKLSALTDLGAGTLSATGTIQDAQSGFRLSIDSIAPVAEADSMLRFAARLDWIPATDIRVVYRTMAGTARAGWRYADTTASVVFTAGSRTASFAVRMTTDSLWEPLEYFSIRLDSIVGSRVPVATDSVARAWIREGKALVVTYDTPDDTLREDSAGTVPVKIRLSQPTSFAFKVRVPSTSGATASEPSDFTYKGTSGDTLVVPAGNRTWSFGVAVVADVVEEADEIVSLGLFPVDSGETGKPDIWNLTLLDDDHRMKVIIQTPVDSSHTKDTSHTITWTVDGKPQPTTDTVFNIPGWNCVERSVTDRFGRVFSDKNCIWLDITPPVVTVFKITGWNPHDRTQDTTWWGDLAKTRYGKDTIWYEVRDSIQNSDGKSWRVKLDTLYTVTDFRVDGLHPTQVKACDSVGNCGIDTGWIDLTMTLPSAVGGVYLDRNGDGRVDAMIVELTGAWNADFLPTFDAPMPPEIRKGLRTDSLKPYVTVAGAKDFNRFLVPVVEPFRFGATSTDSLFGVMWETWTTGKANPDSFAIRDSVAPVITKAVVVRVENYKDPDTVYVTPSEGLRNTGKSWLQVGFCDSGRKVCDDSDLVWHTVPVDSVQKLSDGRYWFLVPPGDSGSVTPGFKVRFMPGVSDLHGNVTEKGNVNWATQVEGAPRPEMVRVSVPNRIPFIPPSEKNRSAPGGLLIRATKGNVSGGSATRDWWEPGKGYTGANETVRSVCPDTLFCNGPTLYINRPVKLIIYIYDNGGTYVMDRTIDITQADLDNLDLDQIDRLSIELEWNHRTTSGQLVSTGVYVWRIVSYVKVDGLSNPVIKNQLFKLGVNIRPAGGLF
jgi:hypothetical protein